MAKESAADKHDDLESRVSRIEHRLSIGLDLGMHDPPDTVLVERPPEPGVVPIALEPPGMFPDPAYSASREQTARETGTGEVQVRAGKEVLVPAGPNQDDSEKQRATDTTSAPQSSRETVRETKEAQQDQVKAETPRRHRPAS